MSSTLAPQPGPARLGSARRLMALADSTQPYPQALERLKAHFDLSFRALADLTRSADPQRKGLGSAYLQQLSSGATHPTEPTLIAHLELIARAVGIEPRYFREYREWQAAEAARLLAARIGMDDVLAALRALEAKGAKRAKR